MKSPLKWFALLASVCGLFSMAQAHQGHQPEDMLHEQLGDLGDVGFQISCGKSDQKAMNSGVGLLHHMMYAQAESLFAQAIEQSPDCAMMYWGYAMTLFHPLWPDSISDEAFERGRRALEIAHTLPASTREKSYLNAAQSYYDHPHNTIAGTQQWAKAQQQVYQSYPQDIDALAFYALSELAIASKSDPEFTKNREAGELLATIRKKSPRHPGAIHYSIHAYDNALQANLAVESARAYDGIAPDVPHALHMPSHIFVRLGIWDDVVHWNIRSANAALKYPTKGATSLHYVHALDYLVYGYLQLGQTENALNVLTQIELQAPVQDTFPAAYALAAIPARITLEQKQWQQASELKVEQPSYLSWNRYPQVQAITYFARGIGAARSGNTTQAQKSADMLDHLYEQTKAKGAGWLPFVDAQRVSVKAWIAFANNDSETALTLMRKAADLEDATDKNPVTPGAVLPARELLGDMLMLSQRPTEAYAEYQSSLAINPNRLYGLSGSAKVLLK